MAKLSEQEAAQLRRAVQGEPWRQPAVKLKSPEAYVRYLSEISRLNFGPKPVRFIGTNWKL